MTPNVKLYCIALFLLNFLEIYAHGRGGGSYHRGHGQGYRNRNGNRHGVGGGGKRFQQQYQNQFRPQNQHSIIQPHPPINFDSGKSISR